MRRYAGCAAALLFQIRLPARLVPGKMYFLQAWQTLMERCRTPPAVRIKIASEGLCCFVGVLAGLDTKK